MSYAIAGDAIVARPNHTMFAFKLTGADVMSWKPKSRLQKLVERLIQSVTQPGNPQ